MSREHIDMQLQDEWRHLLDQIIPPAKPRIRVTPRTLCVEVEDLLMEWRELWTSNWFAASQDALITPEWTLKDLMAHIASWTTEIRAQAEILARGSGVDYQILFEEIGGPRSWNAEQVQLRRARSLEEVIGEIERETARFQDLLFELDIPVLFAERPIGIATAAAPDKPWIRSIAAFVAMRRFHDHHHINRIVQWKLAKSGGDF